MDEYGLIDIIRNFANEHLTETTNVDITIISDNKGYNPLRLTEYDDFLIEYLLEHLNIKK